MSSKAPAPDREHREFLHRQLVKLGDMMGDGLHHEADGKWIAREYRQTAKALGLLPKQKRRQRVDPAEINRRMVERCAAVSCTCGGTLQQTRSGSTRAKCTAKGCVAKYQLLKVTRKRKATT